ncbi:MAG: hypothetical protein H0T94_01645 [Acidimicrobiia bacterium]|nr:hypothetical protein [Acidimicrobiia bacterium]
MTAKKAVKTAQKPATSKEARLRAVAKAAGLNLEKAGHGYRLVDANTKTLVADDWQGENGLSLDAIERALKGA